MIQAVRHCDADMEPHAKSDVAPPVTGTEPVQRLDRSAGYPYSFKEYLGRFVWHIVQKTVFRWSPPRAFTWRKWLLRRFGAKIQGTAYVRPTARIIHPWLLQLDDWTVLADGVTVYNLGPVRIGRHSVVSQDAYLCAGTHDYKRPDLPLLRLPITIGNGVWVAAGAFIGPGVTVGHNSVIGARAVVTKDIPNCVVAAGNPARVIKPRQMRDLIPSPESKLAE